MNWALCRILWSFLSEFRTFLPCVPTVPSTCPTEILVCEQMGTSTRKPLKAPVGRKQLRQEAGRLCAASRVEHRSEQRCRQPLEASPVGHRAQWHLQSGTVSGIKTLFKTLLIKKQPWLTKQTEVSSVKVPDAGSWLLWQQPLQVVCCHLDQLLGHL